MQHLCLFYIYNHSYLSILWPLIFWHTLVIHRIVSVGKSLWGIYLSIQCTWTSLEIKLIDLVNSVRLLTRGNAAGKAVVLLQNSLLMIVSQCACVSSLNSTIHVSILLFMFVCSFVNKQLDSVVSYYFPQRVQVLHAWRITLRCENSNLGELVCQSEK